MDAILGPTPHGAVQVTGADRASYLEAVVSQRIEGLDPGSATSALYLDVHGSPLAAFDIAVLPERLVLIVPADAVEEVVGTLGGRTFLADASFAALDAEVLALRGYDATAALGKAGIDVTAGAAAEHEGVVAVGHDHGAELIGPADRLESLVARLADLGLRRVDEAEVGAWELAHGVPRWGSEIVAGQLPEELGLLPTHVHLQKGCYPGQEAVARMWQLGRPRRRLAVVEADDGVVAGWEAGSGRSRARVTRVAVHDGRRLAFAFVPGDASEGDRFEGDDDASIRVVSLVGEGRTVPGHDPAVARRRDRR